jgi:hypothetical protein
MIWFLSLNRWLGMIGYYEKGPAPFYAYGHPNAVPAAPNPQGDWPPQITPPAIGDNEYIPTAAELAAQSNVKKHTSGSNSKPVHHHSTSTSSHQSEVPTLTTPATPSPPAEVTAAAETPSIGTSGEPCIPSSNPSKFAVLLPLSSSLVALSIIDVCV